MTGHHILMLLLWLGALISFLIGIFDRQRAINYCALGMALWITAVMAHILWP